MGYLSVTLKPTLPVAAIIQSDKTDKPFAAGDIIFDWFAFDVPNGTLKLESITLLIRGENGVPQTARDVEVYFAKSDSDGTAPASLGTENVSTTGFGYYNNLLGFQVIDLSNYGGKLDYMSMATLGVSAAGGGAGTNLVLQGEPNSGTNVGYDTLYVGLVGGASYAHDFATGVILNDAENIAVGGTALVTDGVDANKVFAPGDIILKHDSDTVVGTVKSVSANLITLESPGSGVIIANDDELVNSQPVTVILGFEQ